MQKKHFSLILTAVLLVTFCFMGFKSDGNNDPRGSKTTVNSPIVSTRHTVQVSPFTTTLFSDDFDGANDTTSLKARGYSVWYRGSGPQGLTATWYQGVDVAGGGPFDSYNGPTTGYVAANFNVVTGTNNIDSWLVLPYVTGGLIAGDSLAFYQRSPDGSIYPDSLTVSYSAAGDSIPEGTWVLVGKFKGSTSGWQQFGFAVPTTGAHGRIAIRYKVVNGGPSGANSDYIGIDALRLTRGTVGIQQIGTLVPKDYALNQNYPNPFNPTTNIDFGIPKAGNVKIVVYDMLGKEIKTLVNEYKEAGSYKVSFDASNLPSGVYIYKIQSGAFSKSVKMSLVK